MVKEREEVINELKEEVKKRADITELKRGNEDASMIESRQKGKKAGLPRRGQKASSPLEVVAGAKYEKYFTVTFKRDGVK